MNKGQLHLRIIECDDGTWECHRGNAIIGFHASIAEALADATYIALASTPSAIYVHLRDGTVERVANYPASQ